MWPKWINILFAVLMAAFAVDKVFHHGDLVFGGVYLLLAVVNVFVFYEKKRREA